jgi:hypothetical protein
MRILLVLLCTLLVSASDAMADLPESKFLEKAFGKDMLPKWTDYKGILCFPEGRYLLRSKPENDATIIKNFTVNKITYSTDRKDRKSSDEEKILSRVQEMLDASVFLVSAFGWDDEYPGTKFCTPYFNNDKDFVEIYIDWKLKEKGWFSLKQKGAKKELPNNTYYFPVGKIPVYELSVAWNDNNEIVSQKIVRKSDKDFPRESRAPSEYQDRRLNTLYKSVYRANTRELKNGWIWLSGSEYIEANSKQLIYFKWIKWEVD